MATEQVSSQSGIISLDSYDTALCVIPPKNIWPMYDRLRSLYDKTYEKWPPHVNLVHPYVRVESLPDASVLVASHLSSTFSYTSSLDGITVCLNATDVFSHRRHNTIFLYDNERARAGSLEELRRISMAALGHPPATNYRMHMTVGQSQDRGASPHKFLLEKCSLVPAVEWTVDKLYILVRERMRIDKKSFSRMKIWGTIDLTTFSISRVDPPAHFDEITPLVSTGYGTPGTRVSNTSSITNFPYTFSDAGKWVSHQHASTNAPEESGPTSVSIASYNILAEFEYPPSKERYPIIVRNILQQEILADVLVLQEVTDGFLSYICRNEDIRRHYRFVSNGPPDQCDIEPLPSHLNVVVFSRWHFSWHWLSFYRRHKGSVIVKFTDIGKWDDGVFIPTILSTVHLTCGLTEGSVASKKQELQAIIAHLSENYPHNPWILAGDFNITTSARTIGWAVEKKAISSQTVTYLKGLENTLAQAGLIDAWMSTRVQYGDFSVYNEEFWRLTDLFEGEEGATFDPTKNGLAANIVGHGFNNRPQRYDRILVKGEGLLDITSFTLFGQRPDYLEKNTLNAGDTGAVSRGRLSYASDHWGVRCSLKISQPGDNISSNNISKSSLLVQLLPASNSLSNSSELKECLDTLHVFPSAADITKRQAAFQLLEDVILDESDGTPCGRIPFFLVPVGSYGLGVWTASSDIDCLCSGPISAKTFFTLATQRIRKAVDKDIKLRRKVNAHSGTMLELEVMDIKIDLQYCPATAPAWPWLYPMREFSTHDFFPRSSTQNLAKVKAVRDMHYIRRTVPDYAVFRTAYLVIKHWAKQRGIYCARFGLLGGIQISILLIRVLKLISHEGQYFPLPTILRTFFNHYANFDWSEQLVFDPFFHKQLWYVRTLRESMAILGFHAPNLNTTLNASPPTVWTISTEFKRADTLLSQEGMTWTAFLSATSGATEFLSAFKTYIKIDAYFWGISLAKGSSFVGWLESRCVMLLVDLNRRLPNIHARIWPARFVNADSSDDVTDYRGCYLIGLDKAQESNGEPISRDDIRTILGSLHAVLQKFESQIRADEKYFDPNTSWMSTSLVDRSELGTLQLDRHEWGEYTFGDDETDEEEEEEDAILDSDYEEYRPSKKSKSKGKPATPDQSTRPKYTGKFRSSIDVMNRIRWDPNMDSDDYIVGYEDRFLGLKERALNDWKSEQTDEEFIPQHRILYFKRKSDQTIVWDRKQRRDTIFGSGISSLDVE